MATVRGQRPRVDVQRVTREPRTWMCGERECWGLHFDEMRLFQHLLRRHRLTRSDARELMARAGAFHAPPF
jgi:hypothetical protein